MATREEVQKLASLARISVSDEELPKFVEEFDSILSYVSQLNTLTLPTGDKQAVPPLRNVMRKDGEPHETGKYTEMLREQFPAREGSALVVKQIITHE